MKIFILLLGVIALASNSVECCFTSGGTSVTAPPTVKDMACQIQNHRKIRLLDNNVYLNPNGENDGADAASNIIDTCAGREARRSSYCCKEGCAPGGSVYLEKSVLSYILDVANSGQYNSFLKINAIAGACHTSNSWHYRGTAVDFQIKSGDFGSYASSWMSTCSDAGGRSLGPPTIGHESHTHCAFAP